MKQRSTFEAATLGVDKENIRIALLLPQNPCVEVMGPSNLVCLCLEVRRFVREDLLVRRRLPFIVNCCLNDFEIERSFQDWRILAVSAVPARRWARE